MQAFGKRGAGVDILLILGGVGGQVDAGHPDAVQVHVGGAGGRSLHCDPVDLGAREPHGGRGPLRARAAVAAAAGCGLGVVGPRAGLHDIRVGLIVPSDRRRRHIGEFVVRSVLRRATGRRHLHPDSPCLVGGRDRGDLGVGNDLVAGRIDAVEGDGRGAGEAAEVGAGDGHRGAAVRGAGVGRERGDGGRPRFGVGEVVCPGVGARATRRSDLHLHCPGGMGRGRRSDLGRGVDFEVGRVGAAERDLARTGEILSGDDDRVSARGEAVVGSDRSDRGHRR